MIKNKAIEVINTFSEKEIKQFELFLLSPFYNSNKNLPKLYNLIRKYKEKFAKTEITEEFLYQKLFPGKKFIYGTMKNLMSEMHKLSEEFLKGIADSKQIEFESGLRLLDEYSKRSLDKFFHSEFDRIEKSLQYSILNGFYYRNKGRLAEKMHEHYANKSKYQHVSDALYSLTIYNTCTIFSMLKQNTSAVDYMNNQLNYFPEINAADSLYKNLDIKKFLEDMKDMDPEYYNHILLETMIVLLYKETQNTDNYFELKKTIFKNITMYTNADRWHLTQSLFNFLLKGYVNGKQEYLYEITEIRKFQLENVKFNYEGLGPIQNGTFRNTVESFILIGELESAENFINKWLSELDEGGRMSTHCYCMALLELNKGNDEKALEYALKIEQTNYQIKYATKMITAVAYYNLELIEQGLAIMDSFKHFINNTDEFPEAAKMYFFPRIRIMEKLFKIKANPEKYNLSDLEELLSSIDLFAGQRKKWFFEKVEELKTLVKSENL